MSAKISVVIPTYCRPQLLLKCLHALDIQDFPKEDYEIIVVSDGPDELTMAAVNELAHHNLLLHFLSLPMKGGPAAARNKGWKYAAGTLIAFTDDDTIPDRQWLSNIWRQYKGERLIAYSGRIKVPKPERPTDYEQNTAGLETADFVTANCCCTKESLELVGGFDERFSMAWREDSDLEFRLRMHNVPVVRLDEALIIHPVRAAPWGISIKEQKKGMFNALLYKKFPQLYRRYIQPSPAWNYYLMVLCFFILTASLSAAWYWPAMAAFIIWISLLLTFMVKRLSGTSRAPGHVVEMIVTSAIIPFVSVYWQLYGAWKYRVLFL
jgi:glycosyltransferase involved in cell wall biosynthesis